jgi:hypothetical protein
MISSSLPAGTHVVCIDSSALGPNVKQLTRGRLYSVRGFVRCYNGEVGVLLNEVTNPTTPPFGEYCYRRNRFELPVLPRSLTRLLETKPTDVRVRTLEPIE